MSTVPMAEDQPTMTVWPETANALGLSKSTAYVGVARGDIPSIRVAGRILVPTAALRRLLRLDEPVGSDDAA